MQRSYGGRNAFSARAVKPFDGVPKWENLSKGPLYSMTTLKIEISGQDLAKQNRYDLLDL